MTYLIFTPMHLLSLYLITRWCLVNILLYDIVDVFSYSTSQESCTQYIFLCILLWSILPLSFRVSFLALGQLYYIQCQGRKPEGCVYMYDINLLRIDDLTTKQRHNKTMCIFYGKYCNSFYLPNFAPSAAHSFASCIINDQIGKSPFVPPAD